MPAPARSPPTYQVSLAERGKQMGQMEAELSMSHTQASEYKYEITRITKELREVKKKFFEQKRREQLASEMADDDRALGKMQAQQQLQAAQASATRYTGGGFAIR